VKCDLKLGLHRKIIGYPRRQFFDSDIRYFPDIRPDSETMSMKKLSKKRGQKGKGT